MSYGAYKIREATEKLQAVHGEKTVAKYRPLGIITCMDNEELLEKIGNLIDQKLEPLKQGQAQTNEHLGRLEDGQAHLKTAVEAVKAGLDNVRDKMATEATVMDLGAKVDRITRNHERRIEALEEQAGLTNPHKN